MKIGVFDSGLGGLLIAHSIIHALPQYDYIYLGDTARVPYGNRSRETICRFTQQAVDYLFRQDCGLIIVACNTASADALRRVQQEYLPAYYPQRRVLGVLIPAAEAAVAVTQTGRIGVIATQSTVHSGAFEREIYKLRPDAQIVAQAAPLLVPLIELDGVRFAGPVLDEYLAPLCASEIDALLLGCTHYPVLRRQMEERLGPKIRIIDQNDIVPSKLQDYLGRHPEIERHLARTGSRTFQVTDLTPSATAFAERLFGGGIDLELIPGLD